MVLPSPVLPPRPESWHRSVQPGGAACTQGCSFCTWRKAVLPGIRGVTPRGCVPGGFSKGCLAVRWGLLPGCSQHLCSPASSALWLCHSSHPRALGDRDVTAACTWTLELPAPVEPPDASPVAVGTQLKRWWWQCLRTRDCLHTVLPGAGALFFLQTLRHCWGCPLLGAHLSSSWCQGCTSQGVPRHCAPHQHGDSSRSPPSISSGGLHCAHPSTDTFPHPITQRQSPKTPPALLSHTRGGAALRGD